ncbi:MAG: response regulator transcription factor [Flammeovirgaceae bacterium]|nr:response regulator transcription factor [Flammeovirgaceae bacterium]
MNELTKLMIVDDHQMIIDGVKALLEDQTQFQVVAESLSGLTAFDMLDQIEVDLIITDLSMPEMSGIDLIKKVKEHFPHIRILVLSMHNDRETISEILMSEAEGYILKNTGKQELLNALDRINNNSTYYSTEVLSLMLDKVKQDKKKEEAIQQLTERELEVLLLITEELSSEEIAEKLFISKRTVDSHRKSILSKTKVKTLVGLMKFAFQYGLVDPSKNKNKR